MFMKMLLKIVGALVAVLVLIAVGVYIWASVTTSRLQTQTVETHAVDFPIPFPVEPERAVERGKHMVTARYTCTACHSENFGGGTMVDAFPIGSLLGPNLTTGAGSVTADYKPSDWDRIVRHGVRKDGRPAVMPSEDFQSMSDQELSDIVAYIRSLPPVDRTVPASTFGPLGKILVATGQMKFSASLIASHPVPHVATPPTESVSTEFGKHLAGVCIGCHKPDFSGGPISGGDPAWPPARNLTPDATGLQGWTYEQFVTAMTKSQRPDGTALREPMTFIAPYAQNMTDVERQALWAYLQSLPPVSNSVP
jgi:mono/diheme cytochrome c family protein